MNFREVVVNGQSMYPTLVADSESESNFELMIGENLKKIKRKSSKKSNRKSNRKYDLAHAKNFCPEESKKFLQRHSTFRKICFSGFASFSGISREPHK